MDRMRYEKPPENWMEGLPLGNGRLGAMLWGDASRDVFTLNHEWLWRGVNRDRKLERTSQHLEFVRDLLKKRDFFRAAEFANLYFGGGGGASDTKNRVDPFQVAGEFSFELQDCRGFVSRELDIGNGVAKTARRAASCLVNGEALVSCDTKLLHAEWRADNGRPFDCGLSLGRIADGDAVYDFRAVENGLVFGCSFNGGISFRITLKVQTDGELTAEGNTLTVRNAAYVRAVVNIGTSVLGIGEELARYPLVFDGPEKAKERHCAIFSAEMDKVSLELKEDESLDSLTVSERLERVRRGERDNGLTALYFRYGRYLLLSSTICGDLPANLQGIWNDRIDPPWECDYHMDINLQMSYWMAEPCGMGRCADTLLRYLESFYNSGAEAADRLYGCRGVYLPIQTDAWGVSTPESFGWAVWIGAAPWFARHFWQRYTYTGDINFLRGRGYRFLKAVAQFYEDYLVEDENGTMQIMPSQSPENRFRYASILPVSICVSSAMDVQLAYDALGYAAEAAGLLGEDPADIQRWENLRSRLPDFGIGRDGRLLEWNEEKTEAPDELGHRHLSHLYGVYPSDLFTAEARPAQFAAARKSLDFRLSHGGGHTGWSRAWVSCLTARFGDAEGFYENLIALIRDFATETLLDLHPPRIFQIDGNLGAVAAVIEALAGYADGRIKPLRVLPEAWESGVLRGIRFPGGHEMEMAWDNGALTSLTVKVGYAGELTVELPGGAVKKIAGKTDEIVKVL
ncbi:MAG: glycoside hydrolase family 95 protein [Firmicutes bacterium]|nr:glycoside hydrolase family 95 protein [Bacillota bacterium]